MSYWDEYSREAWMGSIRNAYPDEGLDIIREMGLPYKPTERLAPTYSNIPEQDLDLRAHSRQLMSAGQQGTLPGVQFINYGVPYKKQDILKAVTEGKLVVEGNEVYRTTKWDDGFGFDTKYEREALPVGHISDENNYEPYKYTVPRAPSWYKGMSGDEMTGIRRDYDLGFLGEGRYFPNPFDKPEMTSKLFNKFASRWTNRQVGDAGFASGMWGNMASSGTNTFNRIFNSGNYDPAEKVSFSNEANTAEGRGAIAGEIIQMFAVMLTSAGMFKALVPAGAGAGLGLGMGNFGTLGRFLKGPALVPSLIAGSKNIPLYANQYTQKEIPAWQLVQQSVLDPGTMAVSAYIGGNMVQKFLPVFTTLPGKGAWETIKTTGKFLGESALRQLPPTAVGIAPPVIGGYQRGDMTAGEAFGTFVERVGISTIFSAGMDLFMDARPMLKQGRKMYRTGVDVVEGFNKITGEDPMLQSGDVVNYASFYDSYPTKDLVDRIMTDKKIPADKRGDVVYLVERIKAVNTNLNSAQYEIEGGGSMIQKRHLTIGYDPDTRQPFFQFKSGDEILDDFGMDISGNEITTGTALTKTPDGRIEVTPEFAKEASDMLTQIQSFSKDKSEDFIRDAVGYGARVDADIPAVIKELGVLYGKDKAGNVNFTGKEFVPDMIRVYNEVTGYTGSDHKAADVIPVFLNTMGGKVVPHYMTGSVDNFKYMDAVGVALTKMQNPPKWQKVLARNERAMFYDRVTKGMEQFFPAIEAGPRIAEALKMGDPLTAKSKFVSKLYGDRNYYLDGINKYLADNGINAKMDMPEPVQESKFILPPHKVATAEDMEEVNYMAAQQWVAYGKAHPEAMDDPAMAKTINDAMNTVQERQYKDIAKSIAGKETPEQKAMWTETKGNIEGQAKPGDLGAQEVVSSLESVATKYGITPGQLLDIMENPRAFDPELGRTAGVEGWDKMKGGMEGDPEDFMARYKEEVGVVVTPPSVTRDMRLPQLPPPSGPTVVKNTRGLKKDIWQSNQTIDALKRRTKTINRTSDAGVESPSLKQEPVIESTKQGQYKTPPGEGAEPVMKTETETAVAEKQPISPVKNSAEIKTKFNYDKGVKVVQGHKIKPNIKRGADAVKKAMGLQGYERESAIHFRDAEDNTKHATIIDIDEVNNAIRYRTSDGKIKDVIVEEPMSDAYMKDMNKLIDDTRDLSKTNLEPTTIKVITGDTEVPDKALKDASQKMGVPLREADVSPGDRAIDDALSIEKAPKEDKPVDTEASRLKVNLSSQLGTLDNLRIKIKADKAQGKDVSKLEADAVNLNKVIAETRKQYKDITSGAGATQPKAGEAKPKADPLIAKIDKYFATEKKTPKMNQEFVEDMRGLIESKGVMNHPNRKELADRLETIAKGKSKIADEAKVLRSQILQSWIISATAVTAAQLLPDDEAYDELKGALMVFGVKGKLGSLGTFMRNRFSMSNKSRVGLSGDIELKNAGKVTKETAKQKKATAIASSPLVARSDDKKTAVKYIQQFSRILGASRGTHLGIAAANSFGAAKLVPYTDLETGRVRYIKPDAANYKAAIDKLNGYNKQLEVANTEGGISIEDRISLLNKIAGAEDNVRRFDYAVDLGGNSNVGAGAIHRASQKAVADVQKYKDKADDAYTKFMNEMSKEERAVILEARAKYERDYNALEKLPKEEADIAREKMATPAGIKDKLRWAADKLGVDVDLQKLHTGWKHWDEWNHNASLAKFNHVMNYHGITADNLNARRDKLLADMEHAKDVSRTYREQLKNLKEQNAGMKQTDKESYDKAIKEFKTLRDKVVTNMLKGLNHDLKLLDGMIDIRDNSNRRGYMYKYDWVKTDKPFAMNIWEVKMDPKSGTWKKVNWKDTDNKVHEFYGREKDRLRAFAKFSQAYGLKEISEGSNIYQMHKVNSDGEVVDVNGIPVRESKAAPAIVYVKVNQGIDMRIIAGFMTNKGQMFADALGALVKNHGQSIPLDPRKVEFLGEFKAMMKKHYGVEDGEAIDDDLFGLPGDIMGGLGPIVNQVDGILKADALAANTQMDIHSLIRNLYQPSAPIHRKNRNVLGWAPTDVEGWDQYARAMNDRVFSEALSTSQRSYMMSEINRQNAELRDFGLTDSRYSQWLDAFKKDLLFQHQNTGVLMTKTGTVAEFVPTFNKYVDHLATFMAARAMAANVPAQGTNIIGSLMSGTVSAFKQGKYLYPVKFLKNFYKATRYGVEYLSSRAGVKGQRRVSGVSTGDDISGQIDKVMFESGMGRETFTEVGIGNLNPIKAIHNMFFMTKASEFVTRVSSAIAWKEILMNDLSLETAMKTYGWTKQQYINEIATRAKGFSDDVNGLYRAMDRSSFERKVMRMPVFRQMFMLMGPQINNLGIVANSLATAIKGAGPGKDSKRFAGLLAAATATMTWGGVKGMPIAGAIYSIIQLVDKWVNSGMDDGDKTVIKNSYTDDAWDFLTHHLGSLGVKPKDVEKLRVGFENGFLNAATGVKSGFDEGIQSYTQPYLIEAIVQTWEKLSEGIAGGDMGKILGATTLGVIEKTYYMLKNIERGNRMDKLGNDVSTLPYTASDMAWEFVFREPLDVAVARERSFSSINPLVTPRDKQNFLKKVTGLTQINLKMPGRNAAGSELDFYTNTDMMENSHQIKYALAAKYESYRPYINSSLNMFKDWAEAHPEAMKALASKGMTTEGVNKDLSGMIKDSERKITEYYLGLAAEEVLNKYAGKLGGEVTYYADKKRFSLNGTYLRDMPLKEQGLAALYLSSIPGGDETGEETDEDIMERLNSSGMERKRKGSSRRRRKSLLY